MQRPALAVLSLVVGLVIAACGAGPMPTPSVTPGTATATPAPNVDPTPAIVFDMREFYQRGEPVEIAIVNNSDDVYYYQHFYPACYNLQFFDDETEPRRLPIEVAMGDAPLMVPGRFIAPDGTHCDLISEDGLEPGARAVLLVWEQHRCVIDLWGCRESIQVEPGGFRIEGQFSSDAGVVGFGEILPNDPVITVEWEFVISPGPTPTPTPVVATGLRTPAEARE
jgi:hypothetical protein